MKSTSILCLCLLSFISCTNWAVLVAGSNGYSNYRHQSDVFHLYQLLIRNGMAPENIITFAYDDIANNRANPFPGMVFNKPNGPDNYHGVKIDFVGEDVTPSNFIAAITGDKSGIKITDQRSTGKILESTANDHVFIYFTDHGSTNLIAFPSEYLYAQDLNQALQTMHDKGLYSKLVFYLEACESGSMFDGKLPENINIYATTAANPYESSWAYYCGSSAVVNGTMINSCLGDEYSVKFIEDIDDRGSALSEETMQQQYEYLVKAVKGSHVMQYGDLSFTNESLYGYVSGAARGFLRGIFRFIRATLRTLSTEENSDNRIRNDQHRLEYYRRLAENTNKVEDQMTYYEELTKEAMSQKRFELFNKMFDLEDKKVNRENINYDCYKTLVNKYNARCDNVIDRNVKYMKNFARFCSAGLETESAVDALNRLC